MSATELFDEVRQFLKECGCVDCDGRGVSAHRSYDLNCIDVRFRLADSHLEQFATNLRRARAALKPAAQPIETMDHGCAPEPVPIEKQQQAMALNELVPRGREYIPSPYEDPLSSIHAMVGAESAERSMLEISVLEAALEILREIKEFDGDEQAAYALVTGFQNA